MSRRTPATPSRSAPRSGQAPAARGGKTPAERTAKTPAELEAERTARGHGRRRDADEDKSGKGGDEDDEERDDDEADDERDGDADDKGGDGGESDDERDGDDEDGDDEDGDDDKDGDGERAAPGRRSTLTAAAAQRAAEAAVRADRKRATEIREIGEQFGLPKLAERHAGRETSVREFKDVVLKRLAERQAKRGDTTFAGRDDADLSRQSGRSAPGRQQREMDDGEAHWRRVAGKPVKAA